MNFLHDFLNLLSPRPPAEVAKAAEKLKDDYYADNKRVIDDLMAGKTTTTPDWARRSGIPALPPAVILGQGGYAMHWPGVTKP